MDIAIGTRVVCVIPYGSTVALGETGTLVHFEEISPSYGVRWDKEDERRHDCQGNCEKKHGWYVHRRNIKAEVSPDLGEFAYDDNLFSGLFGG